MSSFSNASSLPFSSLITAACTCTRIRSSSSALYASFSCLRIIRSSCHCEFSKMCSMCLLCI